MGSLEELVEDPEVSMDKPLKNISTVQQYKYIYIYINIYILYVFYNIYIYNMLRIFAICYNFWTMDSEYCELRTPGGASKVDSFDTRLDLFGFLQVLMPRKMSRETFKLRALKCNQ